MKLTLSHSTGMLHAVDGSRNWRNRQRCRKYPHPEMFCFIIALEK